MLLQINHETKLTYSAPVSETVFEVRMAPPSNEDQTTLSYGLRTVPQAPVMSYRDGFGNRVDLFNVPTSYHELLMQATIFVRTHRRSFSERLAGVDWPVDEPIAAEAIEFLQPSPLVDRGPALDVLVASIPRRPGPLADTLWKIMDVMRGRLRYEKKVTTARTPVSEALALGRGVCQDFAHLFLGICRGLGLPARYVSGYVNHPGELATHAWCQIWAGDQARWIDVDPTSGLFVDDDHVVIAVGRDYSDVPPNRGVWKGDAEESIAVTVKVESVDRVPQEWNEWSRQANGMSQSQSQRLASRSFPHQRQSRSAYPEQRRAHAALHQQQGQQQQQ